MEQKETVCSVAKKCGGCRYQGVPYQDQLRKKQKITEGLLKKFGKVEPIIGMEDPYYYRNKVHAAFGRERLQEASPDPKVRLLRRNFLKVR